MKTIAIIRQTASGTEAKQDYAAVEAALRLKKQAGGSVTAVCLGTESGLSLLREAVAMGCDGALLLLLPPSLPSAPEPLLYAQLLCDNLRTMEFDAIFTSCYNVDADTVQTGFLLASFLDLSQAGYADEVTISGRGGFIVKRRFEDRYQMLKLPSPCLISALLQPGKRIYMTADGITRAYSMQIPVIEADNAIRSKEPSCLTLLHSHKKKERNHGTVLTVPTEEAVTAIMDLMHKNHII